MKKLLGCHYPNANSLPNIASAAKKYCFYEIMIKIRVVMC